MCLLWSTNWGFISQKTPFFVVIAVRTSNLTWIDLAQDREQLKVLCECGNETFSWIAGRFWGSLHTWLRVKKGSAPWSWLYSLWWTTYSLLYMEVRKVRSLVCYLRLNRLLENRGSRAETAEEFISLDRFVCKFDWFQFNIRFPPVTGPKSIRRATLS
jgi:hypothetical protein